MRWLMWLLLHSEYAHPILGTIAAILAAWLVDYVGEKIISARNTRPGELYRKRHALMTIVGVVAAAAIIVLWLSQLQRAGTFLGLAAAGMAVALKEPLLCIAGRIAILAGHIYTVGDRIEIDKIHGEVIDVGFFSTRMMELGNWIGGDQASGRIVQFSNSKLFGEHAIFNYTRHFSYIWDEVMLPITYASNVKATAEALLEVGREYTQDFLEGAQAELDRMQRYFLVPNFELRPQVYLEVNSNWVQLNMRYVVTPKKRRQASSYIYTHVFERLQGRDDVTIASQTMDVLVNIERKEESSSSERAQQSARAGKPEAPGREAA